MRFESFPAEMEADLGPLPPVKCHWVVKGDESL